MSGPRSVVLFVEGVSDKPAFRRICQVTGVGDIPVRAGHAQLQGEGLLKRWRDVVSLVREEKIVFVFDQDKEAGVIEELDRGRARPLHGKRVVMLLSPWGGAEDLVERLLSERDREEFVAWRSRGIPKKLLAEHFGPLLESQKVKAEPWITSTLLPCLQCHCPESNSLIG